MVRRYIPILFIVAGVQAQTTVYLRSSGPAAAVIVGATNATPIVIQTAAGHGFASGCGTSTTCYAVVSGVVSDGNTGVCPVYNTISVPVYADYADGVRTVKYIDATHLALYDLTSTPIGAAIHSTGNWCDGEDYGWLRGGQWVGQVNPFTLPPQPVGLLDGQSGPTYQRFALGTQNGLTTSGGLVVSGCPSACVVTITTTGSFNPLTQSIPVAAGQAFGIWGTTSSTLNTRGTGTAGTPYTVASVTSSTIVSSAVAISGMTNGDYTANMACGPASTANDAIGSTQNCVRVSFIAQTNNPQWTSLTSSLAIYSTNSSPGYQFAQDGGTVLPWSEGNLSLAALGYAATWFLVDQSNSQMAAVLGYYLNNIEKFAGGNWTANEQYEYGGNSIFAEGPDGDAGYNISLGYAAFGSYLSSAHKMTLLNKIYNNLNDPGVTGCNKTDAEVNTGAGHNKVLAAGTAQGGTTISITLAASDAQAANYYNNTVIAAGGSYCLVSAYNSSTKVATCAASWTAPASGESYTIFGTMTLSTITAGATGTVTGVHTNFLTGNAGAGEIHVGDAIIGLTGGWGAPMPGPFPDQFMSWVTAVNSDTSLTVVNGTSLNAIWGSSGSTPAQIWYLPKWQTGDCGYMWLAGHNTTWMGSEPALYPTNGGAGAESVINGAETIFPGSNYTIAMDNGRMAMDIAMAADDSRAVRDLATAQSVNFDYELAHYMTYSTGWMHSGSFYSYQVFQGIAQFASMLRLNIPSYPTIDLGWESGGPQFKMFGINPDIYDGTGVAARFGTQTGFGTDSLTPGGDQATAYALDPIFLWNPTSTTAQYYHQWLTGVQSSSLWSGELLTIRPQAVFYLDPRIGTADWTTQPHQYLFQTNSAAGCATLTGWPCQATLRADGAISRTGFSSKSDTLLQYESRTWFDDHDNPENGMFSLYRVGELLGTDKSPPGAGIENDDNTTIGGMLQFGGANTTTGGGPGAPGISPIVRYGGISNGPYGDPTSNYMYVCSDLSGAYTTTVNYAQRCVAHLKPSGGEQIVVQWDSVSVPTATAIATHVHYPQNGESGASTYPEGHTTCPGTGGCASLNTSRWIQSLEDGGSDGVNPTRNYGLVTHYLSPGTVTVKWDCPGSAECSTSSTYAGGNGHTDRISVCGGSSCGAAVSTFESLIVHKVTTSLSDTSLSTIALNPDANWTGVQTTDKVVLLARGGTTHNGMAGFTTTHSGTALYVFGGFTPGTYTVTVGGTPVSGSPFTVAVGDNSIEFASVAGAVSINGSVSLATSSMVSGQVSASGNLVIH